MNNVPAPQEDPIRVALMAAWHSFPMAPADGRIVVGPVDLADPAAPGARVAALMAGEHMVRLVTTAVPFVAGSAAEELYNLDATPEETFGELIVRDVNGDHHPDVVLFRRREETVETLVPLGIRAQIYTVRTNPEVTLARLVRAQLELAGVDDAAAFDAALATLGRYEPPTAGMSPARFIARLRYATPAEFRSVVPDPGIRLCTDYPNRRGVREKHCEFVPRARLTDARIRGPAQGALGVFAEVYTEPGSDLIEPNCQRHGAELRCGSSVGGPAGVDWTLRGEGASLRIVEISPWAESE